LCDPELLVYRRQAHEMTRQLHEMRRQRFATEEQGQIIFGQLRAMHEQVTEMSAQTAKLDESIRVARDAAKAAIEENTVKRSPHAAQIAAAGMAALLLATFIACNSQVGGDVMATVDGRKIFRSDVEKYYENAIASAQ
jgi:hypothetical protein